MGHKIQQLSYNPSNDSVDVIQYYANFAENENPQIYHFSLWSTLMQVRRIHTDLGLEYSDHVRLDILCYLLK
jgi:hypothetical protein